MHSALVSKGRHVRPLLARWRAAAHTQEAQCGFETIAPQLFSPMHMQQHPTQDKIRPTMMTMRPTMKTAPAARIPPTASPNSSPTSTTQTAALDVIVYVPPC